MYLLVLSVAAATAVCMFLGIAGIRTHFSDASRFPPQVPSLFAGHDNGLLYVLNPRAFLARCQQRYGPVYRVSLGSWRLIVVSSGDAISSVFSTAPQVLHNDTLQREMFYAISGIRAHFTRFHEVLVRDLFPLIDKGLSSRSLGQTTQAFGLVLLSQIKDFARDHCGPVSLVQLTNESLYIATNLVLLGRTFPADTYGDFQILNQSIPYRFNKTLLWFWPSYLARTRLLNTLEHYLQRGEVIGCDDRLTHGFMKVFKENGMQCTEGAQLTLNFLWGVHSNVLSNSFFIISFLLGDLDAFTRVRKEIDSAVKMSGSLEALLEAGPDEVDDPSFQLLTSAIMETMRLTGLHAGVRQAVHDFDLRVKDGTIHVKKGEHLFGNVHAAHMDETVFPDPQAFVVDRFAKHPYQRKRLQTEGYTFLSLGGGRNICKGRWLAIYEIKILVIILLHKFNFSPAGQNSNSDGWRLPRAHPRSVGVIHTEDDVFVQLSSRQVEDL